jgi:AcrR family transcriptional regulator
MTDKQKNILEAALQLFAKEGYNGTATSKIAKKAGVSEGLIFRHFGNKAGLLDAIMKLGKERAMERYAVVLEEDDPQKVIEKALAIPLSVGEEDYHFWRLIYSLKWQSKTYDESTTAPLKAALINAFEALNYDYPLAETESLLMYLDGMAMTVLLRNVKNAEQIYQLMVKKYTN